MNVNDRILYSCDIDAERYHATTADEAIHDHLDQMYPEVTPVEVTVYGFAAMKIGDRERNSWAEHALEGLLEAADEEHGDPDDATEITEPMKQAARAFVDAVLAEYTVWSCEQISEEKVIVREWIEANAPHWLAPRDGAAVDREGA